MEAFGSSRGLVRDDCSEEELMDQAAEELADIQDIIDEEVIKEELIRLINGKSEL